MGLTQKLGTIPLAIFTDASNNVGIGGSPSGSYKFEVTGTGRFTGNLSVTSTYGFSIGDVTSVARIQHNAGTFFLLNSSNGYATLNAGQFNFSAPANTSYGNYDAVTNGYAFSVYKYGGTIYGYLGQHSAFTGGASSTDLAIVSTNNLIFGTSNSFTERMRITSGGYVKMSNTGSYIGVNSSFYEMSNNAADNILWMRNTNGSTPYGPYCNFSAASPNNTSSYFIEFADSTNSKFIIYSNGSTYNRTGTYGTISDVKLKEHIIDATPKLNDLNKLKVRNFNLIGDDKKQIGFIAQELEEVFPSMIDITIDKETKEETKGIKTAILIPMLVKAIQELSAKVSALENKS